MSATIAEKISPSLNLFWSVPSSLHIDDRQETARQSAVQGVDRPHANAPLRQRSPSRRASSKARAFTQNRTRDRGSRAPLELSRGARARARGRRTRESEDAHRRAHLP